MRRASGSQRRRYERNSRAPAARLGANAVRADANAAKVVVRPSSLAVGGDAVARTSDGQVVFVPGLLPGELALVRVVEDHSSYARAVVEELIEPSGDRTSPPCPFVEAGCGGCGWQHVKPEVQLGLKVSMASEALRRIAKVDDVEVVGTGAVSATSYRTTIRVAVAEASRGGPAACRAQSGEQTPAPRAGFRAYRSHDVIAVDKCLVAHPLISEMLATSDFGAAHEAVLRCGARTGDRLALLAPSARGARLHDGVVVVGEDELAGRGAGAADGANGRQRSRTSRRGTETPCFYEEVAGTRLRVSARSFFQSGPDAAELLVGAVSRALSGAPPGLLVDAYAGVGLFAATVADGRPVVMVESSDSAVADARCNVPAACSVRADVSRWAPVEAAVIVADPPRTGLGQLGAQVLASTGARWFVLVSCDPGSMARDIGLLLAHGYRLEAVEVLDLFPGTPHLETVAMLRSKGLTSS